MIIAIAGYNGMIGRHFADDRKGDRLIRLPREMLYGEVGRLAGAIEGADLLVNLAGFPINKRWTRKNRQRIEESRHGVNCRLVEAVNQLDRKPEQFLTASAIGLYEPGMTHLEGDHHIAGNYLSEVIRKWEAPLEKMDPAVKAVRLRIGIVLSRNGGALRPLLLSSRFGILPVLGSGKQVFSFIHLTDLIAATRHIIDKKGEGIYHLCAPHPVDNATFTASMAGSVGKRRLIIRVPEAMIRLVLGDAHIIVTRGHRVLPDRLIREGFEFRYPDIGPAFDNLLKQH